MKSFRTIISAGFLASALVLAGCGGGGNDAPPETVTPEKTVYEMALEAIQEAETATEAQAAYDAVDQTAVSGEEAGQLMEALQKRRDDLAKMARIADQKMDLADAVAAVDTSDLTTREAITDANTAIVALELALAGATDLDDADKMDAQSTLVDAKTDVKTATTALDLDDRKMGQSDDLSMKATALQQALDGFSGIPTVSEIATAQAALDVLKNAITEADVLDDAAKNAARLAVATAEGSIETAKEARKDEDDRLAKAKRDEATEAAEDMRKMAMKLHDGISAPMGDAGGTLAETDRAAAYNTGDTAILVSVGDGADAPDAAATLSEDKKAMVDALYGWTGKKYADPAGGDVYEAVVYSNVGAPTPGNKFGQIGVATVVSGSGYAYGLDAAGQTAVDTSSIAAHTARVSGPDFDHKAGVKRFPLPSPNPSLATVVTIPGNNFHGVPGTYSCTPGTSAVCAANVTADGFQLGTVPSATDATFTDGGGTWMFKPDDPAARVMESKDADYASYGWWIKKSADDSTYTASAFTDEVGTVGAASGLDDLNGTATYNGGAAGKYAIYDPVGDNSDAGHFTARATLEADFSNNTAETAINGTIDMIKGADGVLRPWEVTLKGSPIGNTGAIGVATEGTVWMIDKESAAAAGGWTGALRDNGTDGVPQVATGTFTSSYDNIGEMVGAFGAGLDDN